MRGIDVTLGPRRFAARWGAAGWEIDGRPAGGTTAAALDDLRRTLDTLRAVDVFRPRDGSRFGLERPEGTITVSTSRRTRRLVIGALNASGSAFYARRDADPRILLVGSGLLSDLERVFYTRDGAAPR